MKEELKEEAKRYILEIYKCHNIDSVEIWNSIIDIIFHYIDEAMSDCRSTRKE